MKLNRGDTERPKEPWRGGCLGGPIEQRGRRWLALALAVGLLAGCLGAGDNDDPEPGTTEHAVWVMENSLAPLRATLQCLSDNAVMKSQFQLAAAQWALATPGAALGGHSYLLNPARLPSKVYVADPTAGLDPARTRFALYKAVDTRTLVSPLQAAGQIDINRPAPGKVAVQIQSPDFQISLLGTGTVTFGKVSTPELVLLSSQMAATGNCTDATQTLPFELSDHYTRDGSFTNRNRRLVAAASGGQVTYTARTFVALNFADSDHYGFVDVTLPGHTITVSFDGIRGSVDANKVTLDGNDSWVTTGRCGTADCFLHNGVPLTHDAVKEFQLLVDQLMAWTVLGHFDVLVVPLQVGLVGPAN